MKAKIITSISVLLVVAIGLFYVNLPIVHYYIHDSFNGWVLVSYLDSECVIDNEEDGITTIRITSDGIGCSDGAITSNFIKTKWFVINDKNEQIDELFEQPWGSNKKGVWGHAILKRDERGLLKEYFYIGTESQLKGDWHKIPTE